MNVASPPQPFRSGFVAIVGRPNVGKSTLVNRLVGAKVAIVSPVPLTTRTPARGVLTLPHSQLILVDTPALHTPRDMLGKRMVEGAKRAAADADVIVCVLDASAGTVFEDEQVSAILATAACPTLIVLNKADRLDTEQLAKVEAALPSRAVTRAVIPVSAATGFNLRPLVDALVGLMPEGPQYFPLEMVTDQPEQFRVRELIREHAIAATHEELPHSVAVQVEEFTPRPGQDLVYIRAILYVERSSHRKILIGLAGRMLKRIGQRARAEIEPLLGRRVYLDLWVKVSEGWRQREDLIQSFYPE